MGTFGPESVFWASKWYMCVFEWTKSFAEPWNQYFEKCSKNVPKIIDLGICKQFSSKIILCVLKKKKKVFEILPIMPFSVQNMKFQNLKMKFEWDNKAPKAIFRVRWKQQKSNFFFSFYLNFLPKNTFQKIFNKKIQAVIFVFL